MPAPRKRFGQHFLHDQAIIQRIIAALAPQPDEHLIEIGPGQGALTLPVIKQIHHLEAVEIDRDLILELRSRVRRHGELVIYSSDVLAFDFASVKQDDRPLRVFGNLPYNISTPLIFHLLDYASIISDMLFMLQKEVAERMAAKPNSEAYGRLSVMVQYHCQVALLFNVPASAFYPPPQVESSIVRLTPYRDYPYPAKNYALFESIVKQAFGQRRKTLRNSLKELINDDVWAHIGIHSDLRPENLSVQDFVEISNSLDQGAKA
ncbi:16S rRNA (adenine(1518)-N(6)/adenine(1519)-N(6))-dimethyltransferase RsmA [Aquicella lusitana]|uniref:Ribosomal RNA small subunit methyltransferase A n=1 Tax=Aquicella lusitana TaxID=254246 RepID=A0A370GS26_9COXI|nr:16S rRNA (adenine(1518)-N(6)/adenine(1519)-N(6))-dimethyltransferase RsmA [Aquicella lusitana]RDI46505.1 dimethyladenosine transferase [Aquicella lusitana]VVC74169.1 Ribosomal RNA small subunit methyltransferase A [Aquicella lusitana]